MCDYFLWSNHMAVSGALIMRNNENWNTHSDPAVMDFARPKGAVSNRRLTLITFYLHDSSGDGSLTAIKYEAIVHYCAR